jgi:DNA-directed RNA polymerase beta subunit
MLSSTINTAYYSLIVDKPATSTTSNQLEKKTRLSQVLENYGPASNLSAKRFRITE